MSASETRMSAGGGRGLACAESRHPRPPLLQGATQGARGALRGHRAAGPGERERELRQRDVVLWGGVFVGWFDAPRCGCKMRA